MSDLLFDLPETPSPKLAWLRKHDLVVEHFPEGEGIDEDEFGNDVFAWTCRRRNATFAATWAKKDIGAGRTEEEAIFDFCHNSGVKHFSLP